MKKYLVLVVLMACGPSVTGGDPDAAGGGPADAPQANDGPPGAIDAPPGTPDAPPSDATSLYPDAPPGADGGCPETTCEMPVPDGCGAVEICGNGSDDDCDTVVDDGCTCTPGAVQSC